MAGSTIRSYLVSLGFSIDGQSQRRFEDALKLTAVKTEKIAAGMAIGMVAAGGAIVTTIAAVTGAVVGLGTSVANNDLKYQLFARRMFMGTEAAKKMKIATDALGYSLEEIIWGPPELAERYHQLVKDQTEMLKYLGSDGGEKAFRKIRDIEFQFTRMEPALKIFGMKLTEDVINKLFGGSESLEQRLKEFNAWFQSPSGFVHIADVASNVIAPALRTIGNVAVWAFDKTAAVAKYLDHWFSGNSSEGQYNGAWSKAHPGGLDVDTSATPPESGGGMSAIDKAIAKSPGASALNRGLDALINGHTYNRVILDDARKVGVPPGLALALAMKESGMNPNPPVGSHGEIGMYQLMPDAIKRLTKQFAEQGKTFDPNDPMQNILGGLTWFSQKPGTLWDKMKEYNGSGPAADSYREDLLKRWRALDPMEAGTLVQPQAYKGQGVGTVNVYVTQTSATPDDIKKAVVQGISEHERRSASRHFAAAQGSFA